MLVLEYKIKPNKRTSTAIEEAIRTVQFVRNKCLRFWIDASIEDKINGFALNKYSTTLRSDFSFVTELNSMAVQAAAERAWFAISRFYDNCKKAITGKKGYPKFQHDNRSVEYKTSGWKLHSKKRRITFTDKKGIGEVKLLGKWDIHTFDLKLIKRVRIVRRADGYYCQFCVDVETKIKLPLTGNGIGLDVGLEVFYADSNGIVLPNPRFSRKQERKVKFLQRRVSKKPKRSIRRLKAKKQLAKAHLRVSRQRTEYAKRIAFRLCQSNDLIAYEDLNVKGLAKSRLAKSINDLAWGLFRQWLEYFAKKYGREAIAVDPRGTSQICSGCGQEVKKTLAIRVHECSCGLTLNRDYNAAINVLKRAMAGRAKSEAQGEKTATLLGVNLVEQVLSMN